jgi:hypothetical protein
MSAFSALLNQFKQTTQQATASPTRSRLVNAAEGASLAARKRPRSTANIIDVDVGNYNHHKASGAASSAQQQHRRLPLTPVRTIYIACPAFAETGGPEALHQLCHMINTGKYSFPSSGTDNNAAAASVAVNDTSTDIHNNRENAISSTIEYDEFGRESKRQQVINDNIDKQGGTAEHDMKTSTTVNVPTLQAYMLYLRENTSKSPGRISVEHIQSTRARSSKYDRYLAPPALHLPGSCTSLNYIGKGEGPPSLHLDSDGEYSSDLVIWPECWTHLIDSLQPDIESNTIDNRRMKYQIAIWWLSVNNNNGQYTSEQFASRRDVLHLVQSAYAREYVLSQLKYGVKKKSVGEEDGCDNDGRNNNLLSLTEFIPYASPTFSSNTPGDTNNSTRDLDVVYNPAKGMHYTDEIIRRMCGGGGKKARTNTWYDAGGTNSAGSSIRFTPIGKGVGGRERMTGEEVVDLLRRSKVVRECDILRIFTCSF